MITITIIDAWEGTSPKISVVGKGTNSEAISAVNYAFVELVRNFVPSIDEKSLDAVLDLTKRAILLKPEKPTKKTTSKKKSLSSKKKK